MDFRFHTQKRHAYKGSLLQTHFQMLLKGSKKQEGSKILKNY